ncbi:MAG: hypothetical protein AMXMBFR75_11540 [Candidatus Hinthialibacteria bacterium]
MDEPLFSRKNSPVEEKIMHLRFCLFIGLLLMAFHPALSTEWKLIWSDEFDSGQMPDPTKWDYEEGFVRNFEMQYYTRARKENARIEDGMLVIEGRKEDHPNPQFKEGSKLWNEEREKAHYTSASINSRQRMNVQYGRIEVRARLPQGRGVWPAIWMLGEKFPENPWPGCGEIDIMEFVGHDPSHIHGTVHFPKDGAHAYNGGKIETASPCADFHLYSIEWDADKIAFFFDQICYHTFNIDEAGAGESNPFRRPFYLLINLALGGSWGGEIDDSIFPQKYLIDYVRVYQPLKASPEGSDQAK